MKTLYLNRHAKSSWSDPSLNDFARPLNKRGMRDAPFMGQILSKKVSHPDIIYSSPANRAKTTAIHIAEAFNYDVDNIVEKHPLVFKIADIAVINKMDLAQYLDTDVDKMVADFKEICPNGDIVLTSAKTGEGIDKLIDLMGIKELL